MNRMGLGKIKKLNNEDFNEAVFSNTVGKFFGFISKELKDNDKNGPFSAEGKLSKSGSKLTS